jgi:endonuclease/exonuclease/phosphatase family metal-dependent hydrolase
MTHTAREGRLWRQAPLRVMTFNVLYHGAQSAAGDWPTRRPLVEEVLERWRPCVVGFQEATELQLEQLVQDHAEYAVVPGPVSGTTRLPAWVRRGERVQDVGEWCPLFYRRDLLRVTAQGAFWLSHRADEPGSVLPGTWLPRVVNWARFEALQGGRAISVFNTHVDFLPWAARRSARILWERLRQYWDGTAQVVMGDFNAAPGGAIHRCLLGGCVRHVRHDGVPPFRDAWEVAAHREGPVGTFHAGRGRRRWPGRIDHILCRPAALHVERCVTITHGLKGRFPSDHYPVMVEFGRRSQVPHAHR